MPNHTMYTPTDTALCKALYTPFQKVVLQQAIAAVGLVPLPAQKLVKAQSTRIVLKEKAWHEAVPGQRHLRDTVRSINTEHFTAGMGWEGLEEECREQRDKQLHEWYIHSVITKPTYRLAVTMYPELVKYIHEVTFIVVYFMFKPAIGDTNRWDVACMLQGKNQHELPSYDYLVATRDLYYVLWHEFFDTVRIITGRELQMPVFHAAGKLKGHSAPSFTVM
ncbi:hypothetical protein M422DRAFT_254386 [Sphaerobolus stellatus SS14]|uniref:Uncharacterized protein n=1 Tax=Sphaerobolus stellatus (strain SS14) TaxID=990650 RepID=A0A0C9VKT8_SPHS4|nr:hypothetical protein M422DRAFT_254386 [Sphaerobolus stellatus SS14]